MYWVVHLGVAKEMKDKKVQIVAEINNGTVALHFGACS